MRARTGSFYRDKKTGTWVGRVSFTAADGKRVWIKRHAQSKTECRLAIQIVIRELEGRGGDKFVEGSKVTFVQLADRYERLKLAPAIYDQHGIKVSGVRSPSAGGCLKVLREYFGNKRIRDITYSDLETFKRDRLATPKRGNSEKVRSVASVHRELEVARAAFAFAVRQRWIASSPFTHGESLISKAQERKRDRRLSLDEERRLLAACHGRRAHLKPILIFLIDTGASRGEALSLCFEDVDLDAGVITIRAHNTKTQRMRIVGITARLAAELLKLKNKSSGDGKERVFGITDNVQTSFEAARAEANISDLRIHDLRHEFISRASELNLPLALTLKLAGHTSLTSHARYLNPDINSALTVAAALDKFRLEYELNIDEKIN